MNLPCEKCGRNPAREVHHLGVIAAYAENRRECVSSGRLSYCGAVAPAVSGVADPKLAFQDRLIYLSRAAGALERAQNDALIEPQNWRRPVIDSLADVAMYIHRTERLISETPTETQ